MATTFSIMQWNTLSDMLCDDFGFPKKSSDCLVWEYRKKLIADVITQRWKNSLNPNENYDGWKSTKDIIVMEEVDQPDFYKSLLEKTHFCFWQKKNGQNFSSDGTFMAFRSKKFAVLEYGQRNFFDENGKEESQILLFAKLKVKKSDFQVWVLGAHLKAKEPFEQQRVREQEQVLQFLNEQLCTVSEEELKKIGIVYCGDFNTEPEKESVQKLVQFKYNNSQDNFFDSAYSNDVNQYVTTRKYRDTDYCRIIDYIWLTKSNLKVNKTRQLPNKELLDKNNLADGFPTADYPSDHLHIECELEFK